MLSSPPHNPDDLSAKVRLKVNGLRASVHLTHLWCAVAAGIAGSTVKELAAISGGQDVVLVSEGVAPLSGVKVSSHAG